MQRRQQQLRRLPLQREHLPMRLLQPPKLVEMLLLLKLHQHQQRKQLHHQLRLQLKPQLKLRRLRHHKRRRPLQRAKRPRLLKGKLHPKKVRCHRLRRSGYGYSKKLWFTFIVFFYFTPPVFVYTK